MSDSTIYRIKQIWKVKTKYKLFNQILILKLKILKKSTKTYMVWPLLNHLDLDYIPHLENNQLLNNNNPIL